MNACSLVRQAKRPAVATDHRDEILEINSAGRKLLGLERRRLEGRRLHEAACLRDAFGNPLSSQPLPILANVLSGEGVHHYEVLISTDGDDRQRTAVSIVVFVEPGASSFEMAYLFEPILRRRRADAVIDRLLSSTEPGEESGLPAWWNDRQIATEKLTRRQIQVLSCLVQGLSAEETAAHLGTRVNTVRSHIQNLYARLGVHNRAQAVAWGLRHNIL